MVCTSQAPLERLEWGERGSSLYPERNRSCLDPAFAGVQGYPISEMIARIKVGFRRRSAVDERYTFPQQSSDTSWNRILSKGRALQPLMCSRCTLDSVHQRAQT